MSNETTVFLLFAGDVAHGIDLRGVYSTKEKALEAVPPVIKHLRKCYGGPDVIVCTFEGEWFYADGFRGYISQKQVDGESHE